MSSTVVEPIPAGIGREIGTHLRDWIPAVLVFLLGIALWEGLTTVFDVETFLLPKPSDIAQAFWEDKGDLWDYGLYTFKEALGGYFILEADDLDAAIEIASRVPAARLGGAVEVRPVVEYGQ